MLQISADDLDQDMLTFSTQWYADDLLLDGEHRTRLESKVLRRGMRVRAEVLASDGNAQSPPYRTDTVLVGNTPPEVKSVVPDVAIPRAGDHIRVNIESLDANDDPVTYTYRWWRNTELIAAGEMADLDTTGYARGDVIVVEVTPHDLGGPGRPLMSEPIMLGNSPPAITSRPPGAVDQGWYRYAVMANDPDGDPLSYSLETAPPGMTIDKTSGRIEWQLSPGMTVSQRVKVVVEDTQQGRTFQEFELRVPAAPTS